MNDDLQSEVTGTGIPGSGSAGASGTGIPGIGGTGASGAGPTEYGSYGTADSGVTGASGIPGGGIPGSRETGMAGGGMPGDDGMGGSVERMEGRAKRTVLAGIGAVATAFDTADETFDRFVERGEQVRSEWQGRADDVRRQNAGARSRMREYFRSAMDIVLDSLNVPSKTDVDTINVKLNILTRKLDDIQMQTAPPTSSSTARPGQPDIGGTPPGPPDSDMAT